MIKRAEIVAMEPRPDIYRHMSASLQDCGLWIFSKKLFAFKRMTK